MKPYREERAFWQLTLSARILIDREEDGHSHQRPPPGVYVLFQCELVGAFGGVGY